MVAIKTICGKCGTASVDEHDGYNDCIRYLKRIIYEERDTNEEMRAELEQWRSGKRRVFWEAECFHHWVPFIKKKTMFAFNCEHGCEMGRRRVTVGPAKKKEAGR